MASTLPCVRVGSWRVWARHRLEWVTAVLAAGLGVAWLHIRLDDRPKYYRHAPYARA